MKTISIHYIYLVHCWSSSVSFYIYSSVLWSMCATNPKWKQLFYCRVWLRFLPTCCLVCVCVRLHRFFYCFFPPACIWISSCSLQYRQTTCRVMYSICFIFPTLSPTFLKCKYSTLCARTVNTICVCVPVPEKTAIARHKKFDSCCFLHYCANESDMREMKAVEISGAKNRFLFRIPFARALVVANRAEKKLRFQFAENLSDFDTNIKIHFKDVW